MTEFWVDRPTFVTGATGLLGGWLVRDLLSKGADVTCLVRDWVPNCELVRANLLDRVKVVRGNIDDAALLERGLAEYEIQTVFHLAAQTIVPIANRHPTITFEANIKGSWAMLEACRRCASVGQVVLASSDKAYGNHGEKPYDETMALRGQHPYDVSKSCADLIGQCYAATYSVPLVIARCGNMFGGGDLNWNRIVPGTIRAILRRQRPIVRSDGQNVRDYFYVEDAVSAYVSLAEKLSADAALTGEAFNFSAEQPLTVLELVDQIADLMEYSETPVVLNESSHEIRYQVLSSAKARMQLDWRPKHGLDEGLQRTIRWYQEYVAGLE